MTEIHSEYPNLFSPISIGNLTIPNRIVFAGHGSRFVDWHSFHLTERQASYLAERARGGAGLIIQGSSMVHPTGLAAAGVNEVWSDKSIPSYTQVADAVHRENGLIFGQLSHLGRQGNTFVSHRELWAPSAIPDPASRIVPHAMDQHDIREIIDAYGKAGKRLVESKFDGIEVYLAHGYLLCEFLSEFSNNRTDKYGGSLQNRIRLPLEVLETVRQAVGNDYPMGIRVSADEFVPGGLTPDECTSIVENLLERVKIDYVSVSQSNYASIDRMIPDMSYPRAPFAHYAKEIRQATRGVPVFAVARLVTPEQCEELLAGETADLVCLVRPLIADPELPNKSRDGKREDVRECISCNVGCRGGPHRGSPIACLVNPAVGFEEHWGIGKISKVKQTRHIVIVGGGPAGLKAAETASERGHKVTLFEASNKLGGQVLVAAAAMPYRDEFANATRFLESRIRRLGVKIEMNTPATFEIVSDLEPNAIVVATGSKPGKPKIPGADLPNVFSVHEAIQIGVPGQKVVLIDSGEADWKCLTTAERLADDGHEVLIVSPVQIGAEMDSFSRPPMLRRLRSSGVKFLEYHTVTAINEDSVVVKENFTGDEKSLNNTQSVVFSWYGIAQTKLFDEFRSLPNFDVYAIGDCLAPRRAIDAIWDGFRVGAEL